MSLSLSHTLSQFARADEGVRPYMCFARIASINPGIVYSAASICTGNPSSRRVADVIGPIEANWIVWGGLAVNENGSFPRMPSSATKFLTVEELVKVTMCGLRLGFFITASNRFRDDTGITVS